MMIYGITSMISNFLGVQLNIDSLIFVILRVV